MYNFDTSTDMGNFRMDMSHWYTGYVGRNPTESQKRRDDLQAVMEFNIGTLSGIVFPFTPIYSLYEGVDPEIVAGQSVATGLTAWLTLTALGGAEAGAVTVGRSVATRAAVGVLAPVVPAYAAVKVTDVYIDTISRYEPDGNVHDKSGFWQSISAAMAGTFGGMTIV